MVQTLCKYLRMSTISFLCIDNDVDREKIGPLVDILACVVLNMHKGLPDM